MPQLLNPTYLEPVLCNRRSRYSEKLVHLRAERALAHRTTIGRAHVQQYRPSTAKNKNKQVNKNVKMKQKMWLEMLWGATSDGH